MADGVATLSSFSGFAALACLVYLGLLFAIAVNADLEIEGGTLARSRWCTEEAEACTRWTEEVKFNSRSSGRKR